MGQFSNVVKWWKTAPGPGGDVAAGACRRANRNLTEEEWQRYFGEEPDRPTCPNLAKRQE